MAEKQDARKHERVAKETPVKVRVVTTPGRFLLWSRRLLCRTRNVSSAGLQLRMDAPVAPGSRLNVWVEVDEGADLRTLKLAGTVAWCQPDSIGESFFVGVRLSEGPRRTMDRWSESVLGGLRRAEGQC
jgi:acyl dehydratase